MLSYRKFIFAAIAALLVLAGVVLWFLVLSKKEVPGIEREIMAPQEEEVQPLLKDSLNEALEDIEALGL